MYYKVPKKDLKKWIECLDRCIYRWVEFADEGDCPACALAPISRSMKESEFCKCPLRGRFIKLSPIAGNCCNGAYKKYKDARDYETRYAVIRFIKARRRELVKRLEAGK